MTYEINIIHQLDKEYLTKNFISNFCRGSHKSIHIFMCLHSFYDVHGGFISDIIQMNGFVLILTHFQLILSDMK